MKIDFRLILRAIVPLVTLETAAFMAVAQPEQSFIVRPPIGPARLPVNPGPPALGPFQSQGGVWRFHGLAGKCLDVGAYPLAHTSSVVLYDCNGTSAQDITLVPFGDSRSGFQYELQAHGRCLTVQQIDVSNLAIARTTTTAGAVGVARGYQVGAPILLAPCNNSPLQRFYVGEQGKMYPAGDATLVGRVKDGNSANRTPLVLAPEQQNDPAQNWNLVQYDTTPYSWTSTVVATAGSYEFIGFGSKCIDIGGEPHPEHSPVFLYGCNGTIAQAFSIKLVDEHLGYYNITGFGKCFDITGAVAAVGAALELNTCSGGNSQRFSFDNYDRQYVYPSGFPELTVGVRGHATNNHTPLELQWRTPADYQNWQPLTTDQPVVGPKAPAIHVDKQLIQSGQNGSTYEPAIAARIDSSLSAGYAVYWRRLEDSGYVGKIVSTNGLQAGQNTLVPLPEIADPGVYLVKVRASISNSLFSESSTILVDGRQLEVPRVTVSAVESTQATIGWTSVGTPQTNGFVVSLFPPNSPSPVKSQVGPHPGTGLSNISYGTTISGLQPSTDYAVYVNVTRDLWAGISGQSSAMTLPPMNTGVTTFLHTIWMQLQPVQGEGTVFVPYLGQFGPIAGGAVITKVNFPTQFPPVLLIKPGHSTVECGDPSTSVEVQGDMTSDQEKAIWGTDNLTITGMNPLIFLGCGTSMNILNMLPVNITWKYP